MRRNIGLRLRGCRSNLRISCFRDTIIAQACRSRVIWRGYLRRCRPSKPSMPGPTPVSIAAKRWKRIQPAKRGGIGRCEVQAGGSGIRRLVHLAASFVRQPHARLPLRRHLFLVLQHGSDADSHGRWPEAKSTVNQDGQSLTAIQ